MVAKGFEMVCMGARQLRAIVGRSVGQMLHDEDGSEDHAGPCGLDLLDLAKQGKSWVVRVAGETVCLRFDPRGNDYVITLDE